MSSRREKLTLVAIAVAGIVSALVATYIWWWRLPVSNYLLVSGNIEAHGSVLSFKPVQSRSLPYRSTRVNG